MRWRTAALVLVLVACGFGLAWVLRVQGLQNAASWAQLLSLVVAVIPLFAQRPAAGPAVTTPTRAAEAADVLAALVLRQWRDEIRVRRLDDPEPLAVRWRADAVELSAAGELADRFRALDRPRLVITGAPGAGKTTLAVLLVRDLLVHRAPEDPVPVLLPIADWSPPAEAFPDWLARTLAAHYPALRAPEFGPDAPATLVADGRVLPVLDGLDELPEPLRRPALTALNATLTREDALVLSCRADEYAVLEDSITGAVVVAPALEPGDAVAHLRRCTSGGPGWERVFAELDADADAPVAGAVRTPLDVWLLRQVYGGTGADPGELTDRSRFPAAADITRHLLDHLVGALLGASPRGRRRWDAEDAARWLSWLARHLDTTGTREFAWWRLHRALRFGPLLRTGLGVVFGLVLGALMGAVGAVSGWWFGAPSTGFLAGAVGGLGVGLAYGFAAGHTAEPAQVDLRWSKRGGQLGRGLVVPVAQWLLGGLVVGAAFAVLGIDVLAEFAVLALVLGLLHGVVLWVAGPVPDQLAVDPVGALRGDLRLSAVRIGAFVLVAGLIIGFGAGLIGNLTLVPALVAAVLVALLQDRASPPRFAGLIYGGVVVVLALRRRVPLRLMRFLDDAHRIGLLRAVGPVHQFRHAEVHDHLARAEAVSGADRSPNPLP
ncbi:NACHT domain-containing protein [Saccharopolyspora cebuensis]